MKIHKNLTTHNTLTFVKQSIQRPAWVKYASCCGSTKSTPPFKFDKLVTLIKVYFGPAFILVNVFFVL